MADDDPTPSPRRTALKVLAASTAGACGAAALVPALGAVGRAPQVSQPAGPGGAFTRVARLEALTVAAPARFAVVGEQVDAWVRVAEKRLGAVWLVRDGEQQVRAYSAACPHLGCGVELDGDHFICRCHDSAFGLHGERGAGPSPRGLDPLEVQLRDGWVHVRFKRFRLGTAERIEG